MNRNGSVTVREMLTLLRRWRAQLVAGERGLGRTVTWASIMRARTPAFEGFQGGELALLSLTTLHSLRSQLVASTLPAVVDEVIAMGASAIAVAGLEDPPPASPEDAREREEACQRAEHMGIPLIALPAGVSLPAIEREVITHVVAHRDAPRSPADSFAAVAGWRASLRDEALDALLTGTYAGEASMLARASQLGHDLRLPHVVIWVMLAPSADVAGHNGGASAAARVAETLGTALNAWTRVRPGEIVALVSVSGGGAAERGDPSEQGEAALRRILGDGGTPESPVWWAGMGEVARAPLEVRRSATEAQDTARLGLLVVGPGHIARTADLGVYRLLLALRKSGDLQPFVERELAPLRNSPRKEEHLIETLEVYLSCNGNLSEAARRLHLHRNSLLYRLHHIRDLLGHDLEDPDLRLALQLALKGRRVLEQ
ncbi:MAG TPA: helix-turn-helix domain-containing protein [Ktedonobacterales bacterium]|nr:helix-turn-helix domain-containing protein [Ktedonobacterales bacterium]